jgi:hypothetical protein
LVRISGAKIIGYGSARISTTGQALATQTTLLKAAGVEQIFGDKVLSGIAARRSEVDHVLDQLEAG